MSIKIRLGEISPDFAEIIYQEAQVLFTCGKLDLNDSITVAVSLVLIILTFCYTQAIRCTFMSIREIKEAFLNIYPVILATSSPKPATSSQPPQTANLATEGASAEATTNTLGIMEISSFAPAIEESGTLLIIAFKTVMWGENSLFGLGKE